MVRKNKIEAHTSMAVGTLSALIATKVDLFRNLKCYQFKPGKDVLRRAKIAEIATLSSLNKNANK